MRAATGCRARKRDPEALVPPAAAELGGVGKPREDLIGDRHGGEEAPAVDRRCARKRQQRAEAVARMPARIAIVEVEIANHRSVDEGGNLQRRLPAMADDMARIPACRLPLCDSPTDLRRLAIMRAQCAAERVDQPLRRRLYGSCVQVLKGERGGVFGDLCRDSVHAVAFVGEQIASSAADLKFLQR
jgi:hypothetical protein